MADRREEAGFTLIEVLMALMIFGFVSTSFYMVMFQTARGSQVAQDVAKTTQESQIGFDRMVRDTRQAQDISQAGPYSYTIEVDFDGNGTIAPAGTTNAQGDYEVLTFAYDDATHRITLTSGNLAPQTLMTGVYCLTSGGVCKPVFDYASDHLEYDANHDGVTTWQELDTSGVAGVGNNDGVPDGPELPLLSIVSFQMRLGAGGRSVTMSDQAQLRNQV